MYQSWSVYLAWVILAMGPVVAAVWAARDRRREDLFMKSSALVAARERHDRIKSIAIRRSIIENR